jgi:hypothetical protein
MGRPHEAGDDKSTQGEISSAQKQKPPTGFSGAVRCGRNSRIGKNVHLDRHGGKNKIRTYFAIFAHFVIEYFPNLPLTPCIQRGVAFLQFYTDFGYAPVHDPSSWRAGAYI